MKYSFSDKISAYTSLGLSQLVKTSPALGLQYTFKSKSAKRLTPYLMTQFGGLRFRINNIQDPWVGPGPVPMIPIVNKNQHFTTGSIGGGIEITGKQTRQFLFVIGLSYRSVINKSKLTDFFDEFNSEHGLNLSPTYNRLLPILGAQIRLDKLIKLLES